MYSQSPNTEALPFVVGTELPCHPQRSETKCSSTPGRDHLWSGLRFSFLLLLFVLIYLRIKHHCLMIVATVVLWMPKRKSALENRCKKGSLFCKGTEQAPLHRKHCCAKLSSVRKQAIMPNFKLVLFRLLGKGERRWSLI